jgi:hypothetical protein
MTYVECAGGQDRATTTSETHPYRPPRKTRNCYTTGGNADFDSSLCGSSGDKACRGAGRNGTFSDCMSDNQGGYCKVGNRYYVARGSDFQPLTQDQLLNRYSDMGNTDESSREVNRALDNQERRFTNRIRELQIMGKDPLIQRGGKKDEDNEDDQINEVHSFIGDMLFNVGIGISFLMFIISSCIILIQNKII